MFRLLKSISKSIGRALADDPGVRSLVTRYPRLFAFIRRRFTPDEKFGLYLTIGGLASGVFMLLFFGVVEDFMGQDVLIQSDLRIINLLQIFRTPLFSAAMLFVTYLGTWQIVVAGVLASGVLFSLLKRWHYLIALIISVGGGELFVWLTKHILLRPRPPLIYALVPQDGFSFPSGHAFVAIAFYGLLGYFLFRATSSRFLKGCAVIVSAATIVAIGFSRIYLGVHWPSDVLASYASAAAWLTALITALEIRRRFDHSEYRTVHFPLSSLVGFGVLLVALWGGYVGYFFRTHPLYAQEGADKNQIVVSREDVPQKLFLAFSRTSEDITGRPMEPINVIVVGSYPGLLEAFGEAGWFLADPITARSLWRLVAATALNGPYPRAPGTPSFWNAFPNELSFEQPTAADTVRERHHIHFWKTPFVVDSGEDVWFGTAHFDMAIKISSGVVLPTHVIDPAVDKERDKIKNNLLRTGSVGRFEEFQITEPMLGSNQSGDQFFTDGRSFIFFLKN
ncbi:MAG: LssY C-terminal domain-containing protein [bacterium]|nr:LssY C-terminal domain-containing protein [bacterium]